MKTGASRNGYTIFEVMIYLAVTGALLATAIIIIGGQQGRVQFSQAIRDLDSSIQDELNDVANGNYPSNNQFNCVKNGPNGIRFDNSPATAGGNQDCIFIGRAIQFHTDLPKDQYRIYTIAGQRQESGGGAASVKKEVTQLSDAFPKLVAVYPGGLTSNDITELGTLRFGLEVKKVVTKTGTATSGIALMTSFARYSSNNDPVSGTQNVDLLALDTDNSVTATSTDTVEEFATSVENLKDSGKVTTAMSAGAEGVVICLQSYDGKKTASITIGGDQGRLTTRLEIDNIAPVCTT